MTGLHTPGVRCANNTRVSVVLFSPEHNLLIALIIIVLSSLSLLGWLVYRARQQARALRAQAQQQLTQAQQAHHKDIKRLQRRLIEAGEVGHLDFVTDLLPVLDALDGALAAERPAAGADAADSPLRDGLKLVARELQALLARHGITRCEPAPGAPFDPAHHEAVALVDPDETADAPAPGEVVECLRPGYLHDTRVLRSAAVTVVDRKK